MTKLKHLISKKIRNHILSLREPNYQKSSYFLSKSYWLPSIDFITFIHLIMKSSHPDEEEDNFESAVGFMFDNLHSKTWKVFELPKNIQIKIQHIDDIPGHVQSGLYLWPAAECACHYLASIWDQFKPKTVIELGAGCGLTSIYASKLDDLSIAILTDYDRGCINLLKNNVDANTISMNDSMSSIPSASSSSSNVVNESVACLSHCKLLCEVFKWGDDVTPLLQLLEQEGDARICDMIIGTDLLYCVDVVCPLLRSVSHLLGNDKSVFILVSSFDIGEVRFASVLHRTNLFFPFLMITVTYIVIVVVIVEY